MTTIPVIQMKGVSKSFQSAGGLSIVLEGVELTNAPGQKAAGARHNWGALFQRYRRVR